MRHVSNGSVNVRFGSLLALLVVLCGLAQTQLTPQNIALNTADETQHPTLNPTFKRIHYLYRHGLYREIVDTTTQSLQQWRKPNPRLSYWRGYARYKIALLEGAKKDLKPLGNFSINPRAPSASSLLKRTETLMALRPPREFAARSDDGKTVLYRVYSSDDDEFLRTILAVLPRAYKAASAFTGRQTDEIPVFVFNLAHYPNFVKFSSTLGRRPVGSWTQSITIDGTITISQRSGRDPKGLASNDPLLLRILSHETTHQLMRGLIGLRSDAPYWFTEGIALVCENTLDSRLYSWNDFTIQRLAAQDAILPFYRIDGDDDFHESVTLLDNGKQKGDPYSQGLSMTRYLITLLKDQTMGAFFQSIRDEEDFDAALQKATGLTKHQFYEKWKATLPAKTNVAAP